MIKREEGITLVSLIITIVLMLIISSTAIYTSIDRFEINRFNKMINDIELLNDKVSNYYLKYDAIPLLRDSSNNPIEYKYSELNFDKSEKDNENYYILDISALEDVSLNYGKDGYYNINNSDDVYIINEKSFKIYYVKGIELKDIIYYTIKDNNDDVVEDTIPPTTPEIKIISGEKNEEGIYITDVNLEFIPGRGSLYTTYIILKNGVQQDSEKNINTLTNNIYPIIQTGEYEIKLKSYDEKNNQSTEKIERISVNIEIVTKEVENNSYIQIENKYSGKLRNFKIYGNSIQDGIPIPTNPIQIQSVGDLITDTTDTNYGKYKIDLKLSNDTQEFTTSIYLDEPLRKIGNYSDYIDFDNQKVVRKTDEIKLLKSMEWTTYDYNEYGLIPFVLNYNGGVKAYLHSLCSHYENKGSTAWASDDTNIYTDHPNGTRYYFNTEMKTLDEWYDFIDNNDIRLIFAYEIDSNEDISLPRLDIYENYTKIEVITNIIPSKIEAGYDYYE